MTTSFPFTSMSLDKGLEFPEKTSDLCFSPSPKTELLKGDTTDCGESMMIYQSNQEPGKQQSYKKVNSPQVQANQERRHK